MLRFGILFLLLLICNISSAVNLNGFAEAKEYWESSKNKPEYQSYLAEFIQYNNHFKLDTKDGCYSLAKKPVEMMLIISHPKGNKYAIIERVLTNVKNAKAQCFINSYKGIQTKVPPYLPFAIQMSMQ